MARKDEIIVRLVRIEDKLDAHLSEHEKSFDRLTKIWIPGISIVVSLAIAAVSHLPSLLK